MNMHVELGYNKEICCFSTHIKACFGSCQIISQWHFNTALLNYNASIIIPTWSLLKGIKIYNIFIDFLFSVFLSVSCMPRNEIKLHCNYRYCLQIILICNQNVHQQPALFAENGEKECTAVIVTAQLQPAGRGSM